MCSNIPGPKFNCDGKQLCSINSCYNVCRKNCTKCSYHINKAWRERHPNKRAYSLLKSNAKRRNVYFDLTQEEFDEFCIETNYMKLKGTKPGDMTIDRKIPRLGYTKGNLQILTIEENTKKQFKDNKKSSWNTTVKHNNVPF